MEARDIIVVRRGQPAEYYGFMNVTAEVNDAEMILDRRWGDRRTADGSVSQDRRGQDRRRSPSEIPVRDGAILVRRSDPAGRGVRTRPRAGYASLLSRVATQLFKRLRPRNST